MSRYQDTFEQLRSRHEGAYVPFIMLGDPNYEISWELIRAAVDAGADALEIGIPFSDPVADGPEIERSHSRAIANGANLERSLEQIRTIRAEFPDIPIGLLVYANLVFSRGIEEFYHDVASAGADSVLIPDVPVREGQPFAQIARQAGIDPIFIAPAQSSQDTLRGVAELSQGYIYALSRHGVTGADAQARTTGLEESVAALQQFDGPPVLLGFGISTPEHVANAIAAGADGAITGSAITRILSSHLVPIDDDPSSGHSTYRVDDLAALSTEVREFISSMKAATRHT